MAIGFNRFVKNTGNMFKKVGTTVNRGLNQATSAINKGANVIGQIANNPDVQLATMALAPEAVPALGAASAIANEAKNTTSNIKTIQKSVNAAPVPGAPSIQSQGAGLIRTALQNRIAQNNSIQATPPASAQAAPIQFAH